MQTKSIILTFQVERRFHLREDRRKRRRVIFQRSFDHLAKHVLFDFLVALLPVYLDICFCLGVLNEGAQLFKDPVVVVHGDFLVLTFKFVSSDGIL